LVMASHSAANLRKRSAVFIATPGLRHSEKRQLHSPRRVPDGMKKIWPKPLSLKAAEPKRGSGVVRYVALRSRCGSGLSPPPEALDRGRIGRFCWGGRGLGVCRRSFFVAPFIAAIGDHSDRASGACCGIHPLGLTQSVPSPGSPLSWGFL
jgi:hypothetical protein